MKPVHAAIVEFTQLKHKRMREPADTDHSCTRVIHRLTQCVTAKDTRARFTSIKVQLKRAMVILNQFVTAMDLVVDVETNTIVHRTEQLAEQTIQAIR
jgi:hypothetical protein